MPFITYTLFILSLESLNLSPIPSHPLSPLSPSSLPSSYLCQYSHLMFLALQGKHKEKITKTIKHTEDIPKGPGNVAITIHWRIHTHILNPTDINAHNTYMCTCTHTWTHVHTHLYMDTCTHTHTWTVIPQLLIIDNTTA